MSQPKITKDMSPMMKAFINQSDLDDEKSSQREESIQKEQEEQYQKALKRIARSRNIFSEVLESAGLNDKSQIHPQFKNYDHSLESDRLGQLGIEKVQNPAGDNHEDFRPVEKDGEIVYESTLTIEDLLKRT